MSATDYFAAHASSEQEQLRLQGLELTWDPITHRRLLAAGVGEGQRALVVGAGRGSITRLLAELTGTRVVAADVDPRFLDPADPRYEIRRLDITDPTVLPGERFDVIHCRFLLMHLGDPLAVLRTLARCLTPSGFLLVEEPNMHTWAAADPSQPGADLLSRVISCALQATEAAGVWRNAIGPRLPSLLSQAGLRVSACEGTCFLADRSDPARHAFATQSLQLVAANAIAAGSLTAPELQAALGLLRDQQISVVSPTLFGAVAHRP
ncbi:methyltransferase domain-containing protein [Cyanobium sp. FGCU-52]|nr:methyltransferase domain-containing protein [Cyanobium sp. FGCU52]